MRLHCNRVDPCPGILCGDNLRAAAPSFIYSNLLEESLYDKKKKPLIKSLTPSVSVNYGLGTFSEYKGFHCDHFLRAGLKNQIELHRLTRNMETLAIWREKRILRF